MYLAHPSHTKTRTYQIRQSYQEAGSSHFRYRLVFDLGPDPASHIELFGDTAVFFSSALEDAVNAYATKDSSTILEELLWQFLPRTTREHLSRFHRSDRYVPGPLTDEERAAIDEQFHIFDRRRLYFIHYRSVDMSRVFTLRERAYRPLLHKCRDEREYFFTEREGALDPGEYFNYIYAIFNLQQHFPVSYANFLPEALPEAEVADRFIDALCDLNSTSSFLHEKAGKSLHSHLRRYLFMFFDFRPAQRSFESDFVRRFINSHRIFRWPEKEPAASDERISEIFGEPLGKLKEMSGKDLTRLYRKKAMQLHPDQGGESEAFVELTEIYTHLLRGKK